MIRILQILLLAYLVKCSTSICVDELCKIVCEYGYVVVDGCQTCQCIDPCANHTCGIDEYCNVQPVPCYEKFDCGYKTTCVKKCEELVCPLVYCPYGYELGCNNCPTCECRNPCKGVVCPLYHYCTEEIIFCLIPPCQPPFLICKHYCPNKQLLIDDSGLPVECTSQKCPNNYDCITVPDDSRSFCCSSNIVPSK